MYKLVTVVKTLTFVRVRELTTTARIESLGLKLLWCRVQVVRFVCGGRNTDQHHRPRLFV